MVAPVVLDTNLSGLTLARRGKVRDVYDLGEHLLIVATDRISAFDYVLGSGIPDKGKVLTQISAFWFHRTREIVGNHMLSMNSAEYPEEARTHASLLAGRSMIVKKADPLPVECVARGYLAGSAWKDYRDTGKVCGVALPPGLRESERLSTPIFTPATKAQSGHDLNVSEAEAAALVGGRLIEQVRDLTLRLYGLGAAHAESRGILVADTKFEFGLLPPDGRSESERLILIDEVLTPDSSRFWPIDRYQVGGPQPSFDKQFVRDYLETIKWNKQPPVPALPEDVVIGTRGKYVEAFRRLTGQELQ
jgi:phosphoribosylaminoimidazole-succinocarboxamide synthase